MNWKVCFTWMLILTVIFSLGGMWSASAQAETSSEMVTLTEGTNIAAAASPEGDELILDIQGVFWKLPLEGGKGERITDNFDDPAFPDWSPDGERVAYQSYKDGNYHIWSMNPDGSDKQKLTSGSYDYREPAYSPDGDKIAFASDREGNYDIWVLDLETDEINQWTSSPEEEYQPTWSPDGEEIAFVKGNSIEAVDADGNRRTLAEEENSVSAPSWSPDGEKVAYHSQGSLMIDGENVTGEEDVFPFSVEWLSEDHIIYTGDGKIKERHLHENDSETIPFEVNIEVEKTNYQAKERDFDSKEPQQVQGIVAPKLSPNGEQVAFVALNDLWLWDIGEEEPRALTDDSYLEVSPTWSPDGEKIAYSSDKQGTEDLYILDLKSGEEERLTSISGAEVFADWSPDGNRIAFQDQDGATYTVDVETKEVEEVIEPLTQPGPPAWGPDSETIALAAMNTFSDRFREGRNQILTADVETGTKNYSEPLPAEPFKSLSNRGNSGPVWSPNGEYMAYVVESQLYVASVDENGEIEGDPQLITEEIAESPSWGGDSNTLLYLAKGGEFKLASVDEGEVETLDFNMKWQPEQPSGQTVIHAGKLWDGTGSELQEDVDIIVEGNRIAGIEPHQDNRNGNVIDASDLTVMPGLWDAHIHKQEQNPMLGSRQGQQLLSFGITSTMSMGDFAYRSVEDSEAIRSGSRLAPRYFYTSELLEGSRVYYASMRPTTSEEALNRELERAESFDVDLLKTYVRMQNDHQAQVIDFAHDLGVPAFSHYFYPSMAYGQDGTSHISATQRGFSRTVSPDRIAYDDVIELAGASGMSVTSTLFLFDSDSTLAYYPELFASDPRLETLYTPWQYEEIKKEFENSSTDYSESIAKDVAILKDIMDAGGVVLAGTDTPLVDVGVPLHLNLKAMTEYGITNAEALRTSTYYPAQKMGVLEDLGTVEEGKLADLVFVDGNPLEDITDAANVEMVMKNGELHTMEEILEPYASDEKEQDDMQVSDIKDLLHKYQKDGAFKNDGVARSLEAKLDNAARFEKKEETEKVVKHMNNFAKLLENHRNSGFVSEEAYRSLKDKAESLVEDLQ
ncbi:Imidazolonepropionase [Alteribacillus persepolensis]|uniref:Imidazolonepropionase n=1 Tax=Alteribacillus persepolensis TaxID=568899 RepID=A0A1G8JEA3_9BACI|nr:DPP IV N-terminal domain-containing protein [Alteribacillus persepolensis]SDI29526.1 Imidazolonepropionase [Alteribacillus persepolensis]